MEQDFIAQRMLDAEGVSADMEALEGIFSSQSQSEPLQNLDPFNFNVTSIDDVVKLIDSNFAWFLLSLVCGISWIVYITFYSSRVTGLVLTKLVNRLVKTGHLRIGKLPTIQPKLIN
jgi:hypothetical protein